MSFIPYSCQHINDDDIGAVTSVLKSDFLTTGPKVGEFEEIVKEYCGANYASAVSNATAALHVACLSLGVGKGDMVWTSPNTFLASANCALYCGADVDFVDIEPETLNLSTQELERKLVAAKQNDTLPKLVIPVHFAGRSCDMKRIYELSQEYGFKVIEDASHALGTTYNGKKVGCGEFSDIVVFSFHAVKMITSGEGGMCLTNNPEIKQKIDLFRCHGMTRDPKLIMSSEEAPWLYEQHVLGFNYRITDFQCALGISQMKRLDDFIARRNELVDCYSESFSGLPLKLPDVPSETMSFHLYVIELMDETLISRLDLFKLMRSVGLGVNVHYPPVYMQPYYATLGFKSGLCPNSETYYRRCISIPLHQRMSASDQSRVIDVIKKAIS